LKREPVVIGFTIGMRGVQGAQPPAPASQVPPAFRQPADITGNPGALGGPD
jgi:hypothetical protein